MKTKSAKTPKLRDFVCVVCSKPFQNYFSPAEIRHGKGKVCSLQCRAIRTSIVNKKGKFRICEYCKKEFWARPSEDRQGSFRKYCSRLCFNNAPRSRESVEKARQSLKKVIHRPDWNHKVSLSKIGPKNPIWKGGRHPEKVKIRNSRIYIRWRRAILERDGYACVLCGTKDRPLEVDHIKPLSELISVFPKVPPEEFFTRMLKHAPFWDEANGRTLCKSCHKSVTVAYLKGGVGVQAKKAA